VCLLPPAVPKYVVKCYVSITPDTSQRGYMCSRIQGRVLSVKRSPDGSSFIYDIQKIIDGYIRWGVREDELEYSLGYSANDSCGIIARARDVGENKCQELNGTRQFSIYVNMAICWDRQFINTYSLQHHLFFNITILMVPESSLMCILMFLVKLPWVIEFWVRSVVRIRRFGHMRYQVTYHN